MLKTSWGPLKHALWNKVHLMHRWLILKHRFNRCWRRITATQTCSLEQSTSITLVLIFLTIGSTGAIEFLTWFLPASREDRPTGHRSFRQSSDAPMLGASVKPVLLFFFVFNWIDLDLNVTSILLLPSVVLTSIDHLGLFLSECARFLRPIQF